MLSVFVSCGVKEKVEEISKGSIERGSWDESGNVFTNEWSNIKFTMPEGYIHSTDEEIDEMMKGAAEIYKGEDSNAIEDLTVDLSQMRTIYDFFVKPTAGFVNVQLLYENLAFNQVEDEQAYIDTTKTQLEGLENSGMVFKMLGTSDASIAGKTWKKADFSLETAGAEYVQEVYVRKTEEGNVMYVLTLTYAPGEESQAAALMDGFSAAS
jgi:hypothetical protein